MHLHGLLSRSREFDLHSPVMRSDDEVLVDSGVEVQFEVLLLTDDLEDGSEDVFLFFVRGLSREDFPVVFRGIESVVDFLSEFLSFDGENVSRSRGSLSFQFCREVVLVGEVSRSFDLQDFLVVDFGDQVHGLLSLVQRCFDRGRGDLLEVRFDVGKDSNLGFLRGFEGGREFLPSGILQSDLSLDFVRLPLSFNFSRSEPLLVGSHEVDSKVSLSSVFSLSLRGDLDFVVLSVDDDLSVTVHSESCPLKSVLVRDVSIERLFQVLHFQVSSDVRLLSRELPSLEFDFSGSLDLSVLLVRGNSLDLSVVHFVFERDFVLLSFSDESDLNIMRSLSEFSVELSLGLNDFDFLFGDSDFILVSFSSRNKSLCIVNSLLSKSQLRLHLSLILLDSDESVVFDGRESRALCNGLELDLIDVSVLLVDSFTRERSLLLILDQVLSNFLDSSIQEFVVNSKSSLFRFREVDIDSPVMRSESEVLVDPRVEVDLEVLLFTGDLEGRSVNVSGFFVRGFSREDLLFILRGIESVADFLSNLLCFDGNNVSRSRSRLSFKFSVELVFVGEVGRSFEQQDFLVVDFGGQVHGLQFLVERGFDGGRGDLLEVRLDVGECSDLVFLGGFSREREFLLFVVLEFDLSLDFVRLPLSIDFSHSEPLLVGSHEVNSEVSLSSVLSFSVGLDLEFVVVLSVDDDLSVTVNSDSGLLKSVLVSDVSIERLLVVLNLQVSFKISFLSGELPCLEVDFSNSLDLSILGVGGNSLDVSVVHLVVERDFVLLSVSSESDLNIMRSLRESSVELSLGLNDFSFSLGDSDFVVVSFSSRNESLCIVEFLLSNSQFGLDLSLILLDSDESFMFDGRECRALGKSLQLDLVDISVLLVDSFSREGSLLLFLNQVLGPLVDSSVEEFVMDLERSLSRSREVDIDSQVMRSESKVLVDIGFEVSSEVLLVQRDLEDVSEDVSSLLVGRVDREDLCRVFSDVEPVVDLFSDLLSFNSKSVSRSHGGLSIEVSIEAVSVDVQRSFNVEDFLVVDLGVDGEGLLVKRSFERSRGDFVEVRLDVGRDSVLVLLGGISGEDEFLLLVVLEFELSLDSCSLPRGIEVSDLGFPVLLGSLDLHSKVSLSSLGSFNL